MHPANDCLCALPLAIRAQCADEGGAGHHVRLDVGGPHLIEQLHCTRPGAAHCTGADGRSICMACRQQDNSCIQVLLTLQSTSRLTI